jgi:WD40 repeat protein
MMSNHEINIPKDYMCPFTQETMADPLIVTDGQTTDVNIDFPKSNFKKCCSYQFDGPLNRISEICECHISCWTSKSLDFLKFNRSSLELTKSLPSNNGDYTPPIKQENGNIIYGVDKDLTICDKNFNLIANFKESNFIYVLCNISEYSFAIGLAGLLDGPLKIYSRNSDFEKYQVKEYNYHSAGVRSLLYLPQRNYLLSGSSDKVINVLSLSEEKSIKKLTDHTNPVTSLLSLRNETFASGSWREIKIWSFKAEIECIKTINAHENSNFFYYTFLNLLGSDFMISRSHDEFKIWDLKNYECIKTHKEDSEIRDLIVTKNNNLITRTSNNKVSVWQISNQTNSDCRIF